MTDRTAVIEGTTMDSRTDGFTLIELLLVVGIIGIIAAIGLPGLARARMSSNEASAIGSLRAVNSAESTFHFTCGGGNYSPTLQNLAVRVSGGTGFISPDLGGPDPVRKSGYLFTLATESPSPTVSCNGGTTASGYHITAQPFPATEARSFGTNTTGAVFESPNSLAGLMHDIGSPPAPATPLR